MRRLRFLRQAVDEAIEAAAWYEKERPGLGFEFERALNAALDLLEDETLGLAALPAKAGTQDAKRLFLKRFPYEIVIRESTEGILVVAVAHRSRRPGYWRNRLRR